MTSTGRALPRPVAVARVLQRVTATCRRSDMFEPGTSVLAAVSGGPDSVCLLQSLVRLQRLFRIRTVCVHVDHGLRAGPERDGTYVRRQADRLGVPFVLRRVATKPARGASIEAWARAVRYRELCAVREEIGAAAIAVGHTADDQAETVLIALLRGGGLDSVSAMEPVAAAPCSSRGEPATMVRPLLDVTREEVQAFCRSLSLRPRNDPMNDDPAYLRVAVRTRVIPQVEAALGRGVRTTLTRTAALLRQDASFLRALAEEAATHVVETGTGTDEGQIRLRADALAGLPVPVASRVVRRAVLAAGVAPDASHVEAVLTLASKHRGRVHLPDGMVARRESGYVLLSREGAG